jgi:hypothetical protein
MFKACEAAGACSTVRTLFGRAEFLYIRHPERGCSLGIVKGKHHGGPGFREVWGIGCPMEEPRPQGQTSQRRFQNEKAFTG